MCTPALRKICEFNFVLFFQIKTVDLSKPSDCLSKFKFNKWLGLILFSGIVAGTLMKKATEGKEIEDTKNKTKL